MASREDMLYFSPRIDPSSGNIYRESPVRFKTVAVFKWHVLWSTQPAAERVMWDIIHSQSLSLQYPVFPLELS